MGVKLVLRQDVEFLGQAGALVDVAPGYARNYLLPRGLAQPATAGLIKLAEARRIKERERQLQLRQRATDNARVLEGVSKYVIAQLAGEGGQLFGSVTAQDIVIAVEQATGLTIERRDITLTEDIRTLGTFTAKLKLHTDVTATLQIEVVPG